MFLAVRGVTNPQFLICIPCTYRIERGLQAVQLICKQLRQHGVTWCTPRDLGGTNIELGSAFGATRIQIANSTIGWPSDNSHTKEIRCSLHEANLPTIQRAHISRQSKGPPRFVPVLFFVSFSAGWKNIPHNDEYRPLDLFHNIIFWSTRELFF